VIKKLFNQKLLGLLAIGCLILSQVTVAITPSFACNNNRRDRHERNERFDNVSYQPAFYQGRVNNNGRFNNGRYNNDNGRYYGQGRYGQGRYGQAPSRVGTVVRGGLIGAAVGAGAGYIAERDLLKSALVGAAVGAGVEAVRNSGRW
jgi:hypothetical protein